MVPNKPVSFVEVLGVFGANDVQWCQFSPVGDTSAATTYSDLQEALFTGGVLASTSTWLDYASVSYQTLDISAYHAADYRVCLGVCLWHMMHCVLWSSEGEFTSHSMLGSLVVALWSPKTVPPRLREPIVDLWQRLRSVLNRTPGYYFGEYDEVCNAVFGIRQADATVIRRMRDRIGTASYCSPFATLEFAGITEAALLERLVVGTADMD